MNVFRVVAVLAVAIVAAGCEDKVAKADKAFSECHFATRQAFPRENLEVGWPPIDAHVQDFMRSCMGSKGFTPNKELLGCTHDLPMQRYCYPSKVSEQP